MLELSVYDGIPHLLTPVITDMTDASNGLRWCVVEMDRRYKLMSLMGVRNLAGFNKKIKEAAASLIFLLKPARFLTPINDINLYLLSISTTHQRKPFEASVISVITGVNKWGIPS